MHIVFFFFFQAEDGIRDVAVTGVQTCALPIYAEAGGVRRGNQLFGVRAFLPLEPSRERIRTVERAAAGLEVPFPVLELAFPDRHRLTRGHRPTPLKVRVGNLAEPLRGRYAWDARRLRLRGQPTMATKKKPKKKP